MTPTPHSRRDVLKGAAAIAAAASVGTTSARRATAQGSAKAQIDGVLRQAVDAKEVPGVVAMAATDKGVLYEGAFGLRALDQSTPMTLDTVFRIASMTKAITSVAAMQLVEQGKLKVEEPVPNIDPGAGLAPGAGGLRRRRRAQAASGEAADHAAPPADPHGRVQLRHLGRGHGPLHQGSGAARADHRKAGVHPHAARLRSRRQVGVRHQHRLGGSPRRGAQRPVARRLLPGQDLRAARHEGQRLRRLCRAARAPGPRARAPGRRRARASALGGGAGGQPRVLVGRRPSLLDGTRLPHVSADAAQRGKLERRAAPEIGDGRGDEQEPHRQHPRRHHEDAESRAARTTSTSSPGPRSDGGSATCSTCSRGRTAGAPAR